MKFDSSLFKASVFHTSQLIADNLILTRLILRSEIKFSAFKNLPMFHVSHVLTDEANSSKITSSFFKKNTSVNYQTKNCNAAHKDFLQDLTSCKSLSDKNRCRHDTKSSKQRRQSRATRGYIYFSPCFKKISFIFLRR